MTRVAIDREHQDRRGVLENAPHVAGERRLEDQQRQEDVDERLGAERQVGEQPDDLAEPRRQRLCSRTPETAPIAAPITASSTTGATAYRRCDGAW